MVLSKVPLQILSVSHLEGTSKNGNEYDFHLAKCLDEQGNVFEFAIDKSMENDSKIDFVGLKNLSVSARLRLYANHSGQIKGTIEDLTEKS